jgi:hypothetical protein
VVTTPEADAVAFGIATAVPVFPLTVVLILGPALVPASQALETLLTAVAVLVVPPTVIDNVLVEELKAVNKPL